MRENKGKAQEKTRKFIENLHGVPEQVAGLRHLGAGC